MFEREYHIHKCILFLILISILFFSGKNFLSNKSGIAIQEGKTLVLANGKDLTPDSFYQNQIYSDTVWEAIEEEPCIFFLSDTVQTLRSYAQDPDKESLTLEHTTSQKQPSFVSDSYYTDLLSVSSETEFQYETVTKNCILSQNAPLYYLCLHTLNSIFGSLDSYGIRFFLNGFFYLLTGFWILGISKKYFSSSWVGLTAAVFYGCSLGCISGSLCSTPYLMCGLLLLILLDFHLSLIKQFHHSLFWFQMILIVSVIGNLCDYSFTLFQVVLTFCFSFYLLFSHKKRELIPYLLFQLGSFFVTCLIYPAFFLHIGTSFIQKLHTLSATFSGTVFQKNCMVHLTTLQSQLFFHTGVLLVLFLLILLVAAAFHFSKDHLHSLLEHTSTKATLFLFFNGLFYFLGIAIFYETDAYFVLLTLCPLVALILCAILNGLSTLALHSSFNGGLFSLCFAILLCFLSITTGSPSYVYAENKEHIAFASSCADTCCLFLASDTLLPTEHILELEQYHSSLVLPNNQIKALKQNETFLTQPSLLLYLTLDDSTKGRMEQIAKIGHYTLTTLLHDYVDGNGTHVFVYKLEHL